MVLSDEMMLFVGCTSLEWIELHGIPRERNSYHLTADQYVLNKV